jgi:hypothetical protein
MFSLSEQPPSSLTWLDEELRVPVLVRLNETSFSSFFSFF